MTEVYLKADCDGLFLYIAKFILKNETLLDVTYFTHLVISNWLYGAVILRG